MGGSSPQLLASIAPGQEASITLNLRAPATGGLHTGTWQIVNRDGVAVPGGRLTVSVNVVTPSAPYQSARIAAFSADPGSPSSASQVLLRARVNWWPGYRAMRVMDGNTVIGETSATEHTFAWNTSSVPRGDHTLVLEVDDQTGVAWDNPEQQLLLFTLEGAPVATGYSPNRPKPISPYDWAVGNPGQGSIQLCAANQGDPDNDPITGYYFDVYESAQLWNSGWVNSNCATTADLNPNVYKWHVKVRDSTGKESDWSDSWHFSILSGDISINSPTAIPASPSTSDRVDFCLTTSGHGGVNIDVRALVKDSIATNPETAQWKYLDGYIPSVGVWCWFWNTLEYEDGTHSIRFEARAWQPDATASLQIAYTLNHRRPAAARLIAPIPPSDNGQRVFLNNRTVTFRWQPGLRATSQTLHIGTTPDPKDSPTPIHRQTFGPSTTGVTLTFPDDYPSLYWQVTSSNDVGTTPSIYPRFGIDRTPPTCTVQALPAKSWESAFQVSWTGTDNLSGPKSFDIQVMDAALGVWQDWLGSIPAAKTFDLYTGQPGHSYAFRCRATDVASNVGTYPAIANTSTLIDVNARPPTPWWNAAYQFKRNVIVQNNMSANADLPIDYPVRLHLDGTTTPTAADLYNASQSNPKCNDLRVVHNNATELDRLVWTCSASAIDIWFKTPVVVPTASADSTAMQLYFGNPSAGAPPANPLNVWPGGNTGDARAYIAMQEGSGSVARDLTTWGNHCNFDSSAIQWTPNSKFGAWSLNVPNPPDGGGLACGSNGITVSPFTAELYLYYEGDGWVMSNLSNYSESERWLWAIGGDKPTIQVYMGGSGSSVTQDAPLAKNMWHHLAVTFDGNRTIRFYQNGQLRKVGELSQSGIRSPVVPLYIGGAQTNSRVRGKIAFAKLTNGVLDSFPHGAFAYITNEPTTVLGAVVVPPSTAKPELTITALNTYPDPQTGGVLVEAIIDNQGGNTTGNGFLTDAIYSAGAVQAAASAAPVVRWTALPISESVKITLTALVQAGDIAPGALLPLQEISGALGLTVDTSGVVAEINEANNTATAQICFAGADSWEGDNDRGAAKPLAVGSSQTHNMHVAGDKDWLRFDVRAGNTYTVETTNLGPSADTYLYLYAADGTLLDANDDSGSLASRLTFAASTNTTYFALIRHWNPNASGCGTNYDVRVSQSQTPATACSAGIGTFCAAYFNNQTVSGAPVFTNTTTTINYNWATSSPAAGVNADEFSVRWEGLFSFESGTYTFTARTDDGMRAWLDGTQILNEWRNQGATDYQAVIDVAAGQHVIKVEYYDYNFDAVAQFSWSKSGQAVCNAPIGKYCANYFNNQSVAGAPVLARQEDRINYDWGDGSPGPGVNNDGFSARWVGKFEFENGNYTFLARADDGIKVWLDGRPIIEEWRNQSATQFITTTQVSQGVHEVRVEYYDFNFGAIAQVSWLKNTGNGCTPPAGEYCAEYYNNMSLAGSPALIRNDKAIAFDWGGGSPNPAVPSDNFSVRWQGRFMFEPGEYVFLAKSDDGIRVKLDARTLIDKWIDQSPTEHQGRTLVTGGEHLVTVEYYENGWGALANLTWEKVGEFIGVPRSGVLPLSVTFTNTVPTLSAAAAQTVLWNFGDGSTSTDRNPSHTYSAAGKYTVTLLLDGIAHGQRVGFIEVYAPVKAAFTATLDASSAPRTVKFLNRSAGNYSASIWDFGDGQRSTEKNPVHVYSGDGPYTVSLTVTGWGGRDTATQSGIMAGSQTGARKVFLPLIGR